MRRITIAAFAILAAVAVHAQHLPRPARILGGANEITVDDAAFTTRCDSGNAADVQECLAALDAAIAGVGSSIILDLYDDATNESTALSEIATIESTASVFTMPSADKLLIDTTQPWPTDPAGLVTPNTVVYYSATGLETSACTIDDAEGTAISCPPLDATGQSMTICELGSTGDDDCVSYPLGTTDLLDSVSAPFLEDGRLRSAAVKKSGCLELEIPPMAEWEDSLFDDAIRGHIVEWITERGVIDPTKTWTCGCQSVRGFQDDATTMTACNAAVTITVCDEGATNFSNQCGLLAQFLGDGTANLQRTNIVCNQTGIANEVGFDPDSANPFLSGRCRDDLATNCTTATEVASCGGVGECLYEVTPGASVVLLGTGTAWTCSGGTENGNSCASNALLTACTGGGGVCEADAEYCVGGTDQGSLCTGGGAGCNGGGGVCYPAWTSTVRKVQVCGEFY